MNNRTAITIWVILFAMLVAVMITILAFKRLDNVKLCDDIIRYPDGSMVCERIIEDSNGR